MEVPLAAGLAIAALPVMVINPRQVRDFTKATGQLANSDALDAHVVNGTEKVGHCGGGMVYH